VHQAQLAPGLVRLIGGVDASVRAFCRMTFFALVSASLLLCFLASLLPCFVLLLFLAAVREAC
jgi:hypothetical protein